MVEEGALRHRCPECTARLQRVAAPHCTTCGHPFYGEMAGNRSCEHCETLVPEFREGRTAILCRGPGRALVHVLKYHHGWHVLEDIRRLMGQVPGYADFLRDAGARGWQRDLVVPVLSEALRRSDDGSVDLLGY